ncbi:MAG: hypothetical protein HQK51_20100 [Oligoflexia bacterium]|nr:hypothetical protein [Oligoflexia bacterium]
MKINMNVKILQIPRIILYGLITIILITLSIAFWNCSPKLLSIINPSHNFNSMITDISTFYSEKKIKQAKEISNKLLINFPSGSAEHKTAYAINELLTIIPLQKGEEFNAYVLIEVYAKNLGNYLTENIDKNILSVKGRNSLNAFLCLYLTQNMATEVAINIMEPVLYKEFISIFKNNPKEYTLSINFYLELLNISKLRHEEKIIKTEINEKEALEYFTILHKSIDIFKFIDPPYIEYYQKMKKLYPQLVELDNSFNSYQDKVKIVSMEIKKEEAKK